MQNCVSCWESPAPQIGGERYFAAWPRTKLLNISSMCLKEQLVTERRRTGGKLDLHLTNTEDMFQPITVVVLLGTQQSPSRTPLQMNIKPTTTIT